MLIRYRKGPRMHSHEDKVRMIELSLDITGARRRSQTIPAIPTAVSSDCGTGSSREQGRHLQIPHDGEAPYRGRLRRTPQATRSTVARNQPSPIPKPRQNTLPQASHHRFQTAPKRAPATPALATNSPSASSPKPPPQTSKQSRARVRNIV